MQPRFFVLAPALAPALLLALLCTAGSTEAAVRIDCKPAGSGPCVAPPSPPAPPAPPVPPAPPALHGMEPGIAPLPPAPAAPAVPAIPAPPPPPALPAIPEKAHAACAGKADGSALTLRLAPGETMSGLCERVDGKAVFRLRSYRRD